MPVRRNTTTGKLYRSKVEKCPYCSFHWDTARGKAAHMRVHKRKKK